MTDEPKPSDEATGLPGLRTWKSVYTFVLITFAVWILLLLLLTKAFS
jgi:hypothetical protein